MKENVATVLGLYTISQDEIGVKLTFGKYSGNANPGLGFAIPIIQEVIPFLINIMYNKFFNFL